MRREMAVQSICQCPGVVTAIRKEFVGLKAKGLGEKRDDEPRSQDLGIRCEAERLAEQDEAVERAMSACSKTAPPPVDSPGDQILEFLYLQPSSVFWNSG